MSIRGAEKGIKDYVLKEEGYSGLARNINENPENPQERSWLLLSPAKDEKQVDEKQVVFWSEKYARRAKPTGNRTGKGQRSGTKPGELHKSHFLGAAKYVKKIDYDKETGEILTSSSILDY